MDNETKLTDEFVLPRDLGAMAKTFFCRQKNRCATVIGSLKKAQPSPALKSLPPAKKIREVQRLIRENLLPNGEKTKAQDWYKCRGTAIVTDGIKEIVKEIHWYQCENIGKIEFKTKERG